MSHVPMPQMPQSPPQPEQVPQPHVSAKRLSRSEIIGWILLVTSLILGFGLTIFAPV